MAGQSLNGTYKIGLFTANGFTMKLTGTIEINDSTVTISADKGGSEVRKIKSTSGSYIYTGDDIVTDRITVNPFPGKQKGFAYSHAIIIDPDTKFKSPQVMYWVMKQP